MFLLNNRTPTPIGRGLLFDAYFVLDVGIQVGGREFDASIAGYGYTVLQSPAIEVVAYHWHPESAEGSANPHVHFGPASARPDSAVRTGELHKVHFPTGIVSLTDVVRLVIDEFKVEPRRSDWQAILEQRSS